MKIGLGSAFVAVSVTFGCYAHAEFVTGDVARIYPSTNTVYFRLKNDVCVINGGYYYFRMNETDSVGLYASKNWYSMLLASAMAGKPVSVKVANCPGEGDDVEINYMFQDY